MLLTLHSYGCVEKLYSDFHLSIRIIVWLLSFMLTVWLLAYRNGGFVGNFLWAVDDLEQVDKAIHFFTVLMVHSYEYEKKLLNSHSQIF